MPGVVLLGLEAPQAELEAAAATADAPIVKGFAVGRTLSKPRPPGLPGGSAMRRRLPTWPGDSAN